MAKRAKTDEKATGTRQEAQVADAPAADASDTASLSHSVTASLNADPNEIILDEYQEAIDLGDPELACGFILGVVLGCEGVPDDHAGGGGGAGDGLQDMSIDELEREMDRIDVRSSEIAAARSGLSNAVTNWRAICKLVDASLRKQQGELSTIETHHSRIDLERARLASALRTKRIDERRAGTA